jgi:hypothetical protein
MGSAGGDCHFPITCGTYLASPNRGPESLENHPKSNISYSQVIWPEEQEAIIDKLEEVDPMV